MTKVSDFYDLIIETINEDKTFTFKIHGTSMLPLFKDRTKVKLGKIDKINKNDIIFYKRGEQFVLHRVIKIAGDNLIFAGDHQLFKENVKRENCFAKVVSYYKNDKEKLLKGFKYKLYLFSLKFKVVRWLYIKCYK